MGERPNFEGDDPRLNDQYVRVVDSPSAPEIVLVGVVHDHPASAYRAQEVVRTVDPAVVALELPSMAVPLFRRLAVEETRSHRAREMSATIRAAPSARTVGIDAPNVHYVRTLTRRLVDESAPLRTVRAVARDVVQNVRQAMTAWAAAHLAVVAGLRFGTTAPISHPVDESASPEAQAADESRHIRRHYSLLNAVERPDSIRLVDESREESMATSLRRLREDGPVVAVVGYDHLDDVADRLAAR
jgi:pheromone shutdown protein TraB